MGLEASDFSRFAEGGLPSSKTRAKVTIQNLNMRTIPIIVSTLFLLVGLAAQAQLAVTVSPPKIIGQKAIVKLAMKNGLAKKIESARAVCFLLDAQGVMVGQSTKWVIGQNKTGLAPGATNTFNFVITTPHPFATSNLTAKLSFSQVVLDDGKPVDLRQSVIVTPN